MQLKPISNYIMTQFLLSDPELAEMSLCDEALEKLKLGLGYEAPYPYLYGFYEKDELVACFIAKPFSECCIEWHPFLATKYHNTGKIKEVQDLFISYLKECTQFTSMLSSAVVACVNSHKAALKYGWKHTGTLPNAAVWRGIKQDLNLYSQEIE